MDDINAVLPDIKLRLNIAFPDLEDCYAQGYQSALDEVAEDANPYNIHSKESEQWLEGWWAGFYEEKPIYQSAELTDEVCESITETKAANDSFYENLSGIFIKAIEITSVFVGVALVGYQVMDLVA
ncbi:MAG: transmission trait enhancer LetE [Legionella sp.]